MIHETESRHRTEYAKDFSFFYSYLFPFLEIRFGSETIPGEYRDRYQKGVWRTVFQLS